MNKVLQLIFIMMGFFASAQNINMQTGTFNQCSGVFYDSGGVSSDYGNNQNYTLTLCPDGSGDKIQVDFTDFNIEQGHDVLLVFDGPDTASPQIGVFSGSNLPGIVRATASNASGCLTFQFSSDSATRTTGWVANISCFEPCQTIMAQLDSASPAPNADGYIRVCPGDEITLTGSGNFSNDGTGATYEWDLGDGNTISGQSAAFSYPNPGVYVVNLNIRDSNTTIYPEGCPNTNVINQVIQVDTAPDFTGTSASESTICFGDSTTLQGVVTPTSWTEDCTPAVSGETFLPDGNGAFYETKIAVRCYGSNQILSDINQLQSIYIKMEHSFLGDLSIDLIAPNGNTVRILNYTQSGNSANLGLPYACGKDANGNDVGYDTCTFTLDQNGNQIENKIPGYGGDYWFFPDNVYPTLEAGTQSGGVFTDGDGPGTYIDDFVPEGYYSSDNPLDDLVGTPLNGDWTIRVTDNFAGDNGYIFSWELNFDPAIKPANLSFTPTIVSESWDPDGSITNMNGNEITVQPTTSGAHFYTYRVMDDFGCEYTYQVRIDVLPEIIIEPAIDLFACNTGAPYIFDLTENTPVILANSPNPSDFEVTYHVTQPEADSGTGAITTANSYSGTDGQIIYARIEYLTSGCYETETFTLGLTDPPLVNPASDLETCDDDTNDGSEAFDLESQTADILGIQPSADFKVTYYTSLVDANSGNGALTSPYTNTVNPQPIYVRVERATESSCYSTSSTPLFNLIVDYRAVANKPSDFEVCDDVSNDGMEIFDLTLKDDDILGGQDPSLFTVAYYDNQVDADLGASAILNPTNFVNTSSPQPIYVRVEKNSNPSCYSLTSFALVVNPMPSVVIPTPLEICDDDIPDGISLFDLTTKDNEITAGDPDLMVSYYETNADAQAQTNAIQNPSTYTNRSVNGLPANPQALYVVVTNTITGCVNYTTLTLNVLPNPTPNTDPSDLTQCDYDNPGDLQEVFDLTTNEAYILNGELGVTPTYYSDPSEADGGTNAISNPTVYANSNTPKTIYVRVTDDVTGCFTIVDFDLIVNPLPQVSPVADYLVCEDNSTGIYAFDLDSKTAEVLNGQDSNLFNVNYYVSQSDADNLANPLPNPYLNISNPQPIYVSITNNDTGCSVSVFGFNIEVQEIPEANSDMAPIVYTICDNTGANDGLAQFDLPTLDADVLDGQSPTNFVVSYYVSPNEADMGVNALPSTYQNTSNPQTIYARVDDNSTPNSVCYAITDLTLQVELLPDFDLEDNYILCANTNGTEVIGPPILDTMLSVTDYSFEWSLDGMILSGETNSSLVPTQGGTYSVIVTNNLTMCQNSDSAKVTESVPPIITATVTTKAFADNNVVEATATGGGIYEFSLDFGSWQDNGTFENVSGGEHAITARDKIGCGYTTTTVMVIDYPLYFTPNGDSFNDTWNVRGLDNQYNAMVYIYDRFGKLLKQISTTGTGWNGTFNGALMPSSDYWFTVIYDEPSTGQQKEFRSHFSLKR